MAQVNVFRFDPSSHGGKSWIQTWDRNVPKGQTVLDVLDDLHYFVDPTLSYRRSCRSAICGSCAMRVNGQARLACKTQASDMIDKFGNLLVEPLGNLRPIKDLVMDMGPFWDSVVAVQPFLQHQGEVPKGLYTVTKEQMDHTRIARDCIFCGACLSDCTSREANPQYLGPAALAKAFKFAGDVRDDTSKARLEMYSQPNGIWDCDACLFCNEVCPMGVKPMDAIMKMREAALEAGITDNIGARHALAFYDTVMATGKVHEARTAMKSLGPFGLLKQLPLALKLGLVGKQPELFKDKIEGYDDIMRIKARMDEDRRKAKRKRKK